MMICTRRCLLLWLLNRETFVYDICCSLLLNSLSFQAFSIDLAVAHVYIQDTYRDDACAQDSTLGSIEHRLDPDILVRLSQCIGSRSNH
jgi:hypothetical protein